MSVQSLEQGRIANQEDRLQSVLQVQDQELRKSAINEKTALSLTTSSSFLKRWECEMLAKEEDRLR